MQAKYSFTFKGSYNHFTFSYISGKFQIDISKNIKSLQTRSITQFGFLKPLSTFLSQYTRFIVHLYAIQNFKVQGAKFQKEEASYQGAILPYRSQFYRTGKNAHAPTAALCSIYTWIYNVALHSYIVPVPQYMYKIIDRPLLLYSCIEFTTLGPLIHMDTLPKSNSRPIGKMKNECQFTKKKVTVV